MGVLVLKAIVTVIGDGFNAAELCAGEAAEAMWARQGHTPGQTRKLTG